MPIALALLMLALLLGAQYWDGKRAQRSVRKYRARYRKMIHRIDSLVKDANQIHQMMGSQFTPSHIRHFERALVTLDLLLVATRELGPWEEDLHYLDSVAKLADQASRELSSLKSQKNFGRFWYTDVLRDKIQDVSPTGCYFCSRPFDIRTFEQVRIKIDHKKGYVFGCAVCRERLHSAKKVKVLFFEKDGKQAHWSELADFVPSQHYFGLNQTDVPMNKTGLRLITSEADTD